MNYVFLFISTLRSQEQNFNEETPQWLNRLHSLNLEFSMFCNNEWSMSNDITDNL